ncbi:MAG: S-layer homology domain-containing protein, partial [Oscillospiraceae bacterium]
VARHPGIVVCKHKDFNATACPGRNFPFDAMLTTEPAGSAEDKDEPSYWAAPDCAWAVENGLFKGDGNGNFRWHDTVTREELAALLHRLEGLK